MTEDERKAWRAEWDRLAGQSRRALFGDATDEELKAAGWIDTTEPIAYPKYTDWQGSKRVVKW